jgi:hypothetical protein
MLFECPRPQGKADQREQGHGHDRAAGAGLIRPGPIWSMAARPARVSEARVLLRSLGCGVRSIRPVTCSSRPESCAHQIPPVVGVRMVKRLTTPPFQRWIEDARVVTVPSPFGLAAGSIAGDFNRLMYLVRRSQKQKCTRFPAGTLSSAALGALWGNPYTAAASP